MDGVRRRDHQDDVDEELGPEQEAHQPRQAPSAVGRRESQAPGDQGGQEKTGRARQRAVTGRVAGQTQGDDHECEGEAAGSPERHGGAAWARSTGHVTPLDVTSARAERYPQQTPLPRLLVGPNVPSAS
jgi:hypothetical protein